MQAIIEGENGRLYADRYLTRAKLTDTHPATIVEFCALVELTERFKEAKTNRRNRHSISITPRMFLP